MAKAGWKKLSGKISRLLSASPRFPRVACGPTPGVWAIVRPGTNEDAIRETSREAGWSLKINRIPGLSSGPVRGGLPIIIYDREISPDNWSEIVASLTGSTPRPYLILLSATVDGNLWDEIQRVGGCDILRTPVSRESILWAVKLAQRSLNNQERVRYPLPNVR